MDVGTPRDVIGINAAADGGDEDGDGDTEAEAEAEEEGEERHRSHAVPDGMPSVRRRSLAIW